MRSAKEASERQQYLAFTLAGGDYGLGILKVKEILQYESITQVPSTPRSIRGVINLRGSVVPVVDLAVKFGLPETPLTKRTCILVVETSLDGVATVMGLMTDAVSEVIELGPEDVEMPPSFGSRVKVDYLRGMGKVGRRFVLLLDIDRILTADERELAVTLEESGVSVPEGAEPAAAEEALPVAPAPAGEVPAP